MSAFAEHYGPPEPTLAVGDPRRVAIGRAAFGTLWASVLFFGFTVPTKQLAPIYDHAPWLNDPYDAVYSFAMFFVPALALFFMVQVSLCRKAQPVSIRRLVSIVRACRVTLGVIAVTLASCWISVADGANRSAWTAAVTSFLVAYLTVVTVVTGRAAIHLRVAPRLSDAGASHDWLTDLIVAAKRESRWFGPLRPSVLAAIGWTERSFAAPVRRHPVIAAAIASIGFGVAVGLNQALREAYVGSAALLTIALLACGTFAFLVAAGSHLSIVKSRTPLHGGRRRALDATVAACIAALIALAFRDSLWWVVGGRSSRATTGRLAELIAVAMLAAFALVLGIETLTARRRDAEEVRSPPVESDV